MLALASACATKPSSSLGSSEAQDSSAKHAAVPSNLTATIAEDEARERADRPILEHLWNESVASYASLQAHVDGAPPSQPASQPVPTRSPSTRPAAPAIRTSRLDAQAALTIAGSRSGLDAVRHRGRTYLALRSAPSPLADPESIIEIISSQDDVTWRSETRLATNHELQSPRFLALNGRLLVYASELSTSPYRLEPRHVYASELGKNHLWSPWQTLELDGHVVWQTSVERGIPLMTTYALGKKTYEFDEGQLEVRLLTTQDGYRWEPLQRGRRAVFQGGGREAAFSSDDDGNLYSVVRNEVSDEAHFGSAVCSAPSFDWTAWDCVKDSRAYEAPVLFQHKSHIYLLARRHLGNETTTSKLQPSLLRRFKSQADELAAPKRCSLWSYDRAHKRIEFVLDLPSRGDTCSPAVINGARPGEFIVYDHSWDPGAPDLPPITAKWEPTHLYRHVLSFE